VLLLLLLLLLCSKLLLLCCCCTAVGGVNLGKGIVALPQKLGGGVSLTDLETGKSLASLWYSNYGELCVSPSLGDPGSAGLGQHAGTFKV